MGLLSILRYRERNSNPRPRMEEQVYNSLVPLHSLSPTAQQSNRSPTYHQATKENMKNADCELGDNRMRWKYEKTNPQADSATDPRQNPLDFRPTRCIPQYPSMEIPDLHCLLSTLRLILTSTSKFDPEQRKLPIYPVSSPLFIQIRA